MSEPDDLRERLRAADPAREQPALTAGERERLLGRATRATGRVGKRTEGRSRAVPWLAAAAAALVLGGAGWAGLAPAGDDEAATPTAADPAAPTSPTSPTSPTADPGPVVRLGLPAATTARCMVPDPRVLRNQEVAFEGTVTEADGDRVVLEVGTWFRGGDERRGGATVEVDAVADRFEQLLLAPDLQVGGTYLVSATDGEVTLCGFSGEATPRLRGLYARAFG